MAAPGGVELATFAAIGLLGGAHCLGMCGPLVTTYARRIESAPASEPPATGPTAGSGGEATEPRTDGAGALSRRALRQHALFNVGRTAGYATAGGVMGLLGAVVYDTAAVTGTATALRAVAGVLVGLLVIVTGVRYLAGRPGGGVPGPLPGLGELPGVGSAFARVHDALSGRLLAWVRGPRIAALGVVHAILPCPLLWPAYLYALALGDPLRGALALGVLGLGTLPTLFAFGTVMGTVGADRRRRLHRALGAAFLVLGLLPLTMGLRLAGVDLPRLPVPFFQPL